MYRKNICKRTELYRVSDKWLYNYKHAGWPIVSVYDGHNKQLLIWAEKYVLPNDVRARRFKNKTLEDGLCCQTRQYQIDEKDYKVETWRTKKERWTTIIEVDKCCEGELEQARLKKARTGLYSGRNSSLCFCRFIVVAKTRCGIQNNLYEIHSSTYICCFEK